MKSGSFIRVAGALAVVALVLRIAYVLAIGPRAPLGLDGTWYALQAGTIADGAGYVDPGRFYAFRGAVPTAQFPPLWPGLLALVHEVGFESLRSYRIVGGFVGATTVLMTAFIGRRLVSEPVGLVAAAIVAVSPFMIAADASLMAESLFVALITAAVLVAIDAASTRARDGSCCSESCSVSRRSPEPTASWSVQPSSLSPPGACRRRCSADAPSAQWRAAWCSWCSSRGRSGTSTRSMRSYRSRTTPAACWAEPTAHPRIPATSEAGTSSASGPSSGRAVPRRNARTPSGRPGWDTRADHLPRLAMTVPVRILRGWGLWSPVVLADAESIESRNRTTQLAGWAVELVILGLAVGGAVVAVRTRVRVAPLFAVIGAATFVLVASWGNQRFRLVAEPELAIFAAIAVHSMWSSLRSTRSA